MTPFFDDEQRGICIEAAEVAIADVNLCRHALTMCTVLLDVERAAFKDQLASLEQKLLKMAGACLPWG